ncbi:MAG: hypothetical protein KAW12_29100 [Candidatus Aminicenantes bacterium]|nr:hypothetical protein [Candidatus Aminicenantes bacterium]
MTAEERIKAFREKLPDYWPDEVPLVESDAERSWEELGRFWQYCLTAAIFGNATGKIIEAQKILRVIEEIENEPITCDQWQYNPMYLQFITSFGPLPPYANEANMTYRERWEAINSYWRKKLEHALIHFGDEATPRKALNLMTDIERRFATEGPY